MNTKQLKRQKGYEFECNISEEYKNSDACDEWGCAYVWLGTDIGTEYNFCIDSGTDSSAIYKMELNKKTNYMETDGGTFVSYEIDFSNEKWKEKLEDAMCKALIKFFGL